MSSSAIQTGVQPQSYSWQDPAGAGTVSAVMLQWDTTNFLTFDVCTTRTHEGSSDVTEHPVETGANIADHIRPNLDKITLEVFVSNSPLYGTGTNLPQTLFAPQFHPSTSLTYLQLAEDAATAVEGGPLTAVALLATGALPSGPPEVLNVSTWQFTSLFDAVKDTLDQLRLFKKNSTLLTVITPEHTYSNMALESYSVSKTQDSGTGGNITMSLKEVLIVATTTTTNVPQAAVIRATPKVNKGAKAPVDVTTQDSSLLENLLGL